MKLYYSPGACSLSPHIVLREAGLDFEPVLTSTKTHKLEDGTDYYKINPKGYVPTLELDDGKRLTEGPAIVQYLADLVPLKKLAPPNGTMERYRLQEWLNFISTELHKQFSPLFNAAVPQEYKAMLRTKLGERFAWVNEQLEGNAFLMGDTFTVADAYLYVIAGWGKPAGVDISGLKHLYPYWKRIGERPAVKEALALEQLKKK